MDHLTTLLRRRDARRHARPDDGQAAVELALVLPAVVLLLLALVQFALIGRDELLVVHAAREAARAASVAGSGDGRRAADPAGSEGGDLGRRARGRSRRGRRVVPVGDRSAAHRSARSRSVAPRAGHDARGAVAMTAGMTTGSAASANGERGSVALLVCGLVGLAVLLMLAIVAVGGAVVLAGRAEAAADGAALAAADTLALGTRGSPCAAAAAVAEVDGALLVECRLEPQAVEVVVELVGDGPAALGRTVRAALARRARPRGRVPEAASRRRRVTAPRLSSHSFQLPHFGDCTHEGQPSSQGHDAMSSSVAATCRAAAANASSAMPAPPG